MTPRECEQLDVLAASLQRMDNKLSLIDDNVKMIVAEKNRYMASLQAIARLATASPAKALEGALLDRIALEATKALGDNSP